MRRVFGPRFLAILVTATLLLGMTLAVPLFGGTVQAQEDSLDQDNAAQKASDLARAYANGGVSLDRVVVVYADPTSINDVIRQRVRQKVMGKLLKADRALRRDVLRVPGGRANDIAQIVKRLPGVQDAYPDQVATATLVANDPLAESEWGLAKIEAPSAWDTAQGQGVTVAVLDCGIYEAHPDLAGKVVLAQNFSSSSTTDDRCNHGTHVAGTIAANTDNGVGVAGVAPGATLLNGKVLDDSGSGFFSDIGSGIRWATDNGARVISMSLSGNTTCPTDVQNAVNYAWDHGVLIVAAAGNDGKRRVGAPANCQNVISVGATDANDARPKWSNYGPNVTVVAPGANILSTVNPSLNQGSSYAYFNGTSMATPHVSGVLALLWSSSYGTNAPAIRDRLYETADKITGTGSLSTYGRINAENAVTGGDVVPTLTPSPTATPNSDSTTTPTSTPTPLASATPTATHTVTPSPTATMKPSPSLTPTQTPTTTPSATATPAPVLSFTTSTTLSANSVAAGNSIRVQASVTSATAAKVRVVLEIHDPSGAGAKQWSFNNQKFTAGQSRQYSKTWRVPRTADTGIYVVTIGIFDAESGEQYLEDDNAGQFSVTARSTREGR